jgi:NNP family nitrate/nitrite transporter-like MFS transporter
MILYGVLALCMMTMFLALKGERYRDRVNQAMHHNFLDDD